MAKELDKVRSQIAELKKKEKNLAEEKERRDMEEAKAIIEKRKIEPELLKKICDLKETEIREILEKRKKENDEIKKALN